MSRTASYRIVRFFQRRGKRRQVVAHGLTFDEAQAHCRDPQTSSSTATEPQARQRTREHGPWFDGYEVDD